MKDEFVLMQCSSCNEYRLPVFADCNMCLSPDYTWEPASGKGTVRTFGIMHQRYHAGFEPELPYNIIVVELEEGPRLTSNMVGVENDRIRIGMAVEITWEQHDDVAIPKFRPT